MYMFLFLQSFLTGYLLVYNKWTSVLQIESYFPIKQNGFHVVPLDEWRVGWKQPIKTWNLNWRHVWGPRVVRSTCSLIWLARATCFQTPRMPLSPCCVFVCTICCDVCIIDEKIFMKLNSKVFVAIKAGWFIVSFRLPRPTFRLWYIATCTKCQQQ